MSCLNTDAIPVLKRKAQTRFAYSRGNTYVIRLGDAAAQDMRGAQADHLKAPEDEIITKFYPDDRIKAYILFKARTGACFKGAKDAIDRLFDIPR